MARTVQHTLDAQGPLRLDFHHRLLEKIEPVPAQARPGLIPIVPASSWSWSGEWPARPFHYLSPDGTSFIAADEAFVTGATSWGVKGTDLLRFGLAPASPGAPFYHSNDGMSVTYAMDVTPDGGVRNVRPFVQRGGESVTVDSAGDVYVTSGDVLAFDAEGRWIDTIDVPERATHIAFGGDDGRTLFIAARSALYSLRMRHSRR
jgi:hypothetical protein